MRPRIKEQKRNLYFCPRRIISIIARQLVTLARGLKSSWGTPIPRRAIGATRGVAARIGQRSRSVQAPGQHRTRVHRNDAKTVTSPLHLSFFARLTGVVVVYISSSPALVIKTRPLRASWRRGNEGMERWEGRVVKTHLPSCPFLSPSAPLATAPCNPCEIYACLFTHLHAEKPTFLQGGARNPRHVVPCKICVLPLKSYFLLFTPFCARAERRS